MFPYPRTGPFAHIGQITVEEYHRMIQDGVFDTEEKQRCELVEGWIVPKARQSPGHCFVRQALSGLARNLVLPPGWMYAQVGSVVTDDSQPEPDGLFVRDAWMVKPCRYPRADEVAIVIEVADVSLDFDRTVKLRVYAAAGIPVYWIVNLENRQIEVYESPIALTGQNGQYQRRTDYRSPQSIPLAILGTVVGQYSVDSLLP